MGTQQEIDAQHFDDVVVGGGLIGAAVARRLAASGRAVAIVERGRAVTEPPGSHLRNTAVSQAQPDNFFADIDQYFDYIDPNGTPAALPGAFTTSVVGGMGIAWTNNCPRAVEGVDRPDFFESLEWDTYYELAEEFLGVSSTQFDDSDRGRVIAGSLRSHLSSQGREIVPLPLSGTRTAPERIQYVAPSDVLNLPADQVQRIVGAVDRVEMLGRRATGVVVDGILYEADNVVLAAGSVDIPPLLWNSGIDLPALGRYLSYHPVLMGQIVLDDPVDLGESDADPLPRLGIPPTSERPWFAMLLRDTNPFPISPEDQDVPAHQLVEIQVFAPVDPDVDNRMSMSDSGEIRFDLPLRDLDEDRRVAIEDDANELCSRIGRFRLGCHPQWAPLGTPHLMGSCRMGPVDDGTSVTDLRGRVWGTDNLYLASNGILPSRLAVNPTLTSTAIALRTADQISRI